MAVLCAAFVAMLPAMSTGASSSVTITANIVSSTTLTNGCTSPIGSQFGSVQPGSSITTSTTAAACRFSFGSSNDSASLRIGQRDGTGAAMGRQATAWTGGQTANLVVNDTSMLTSTTGWTVSPNGLMQQTRTSGTSWTSYGPGTTLTAEWLRRSEVEQGSTSVLYAVGDNTIVKVTSADTASPVFTATPSNFGFPAGATVQGLYAPGSNVVYVAGCTGATCYVARSANGGSSFAAPFVLAGATRVIDMSGRWGTDFWIVGSSNTGNSGLFHTTTGGASAAAWSELAAPNRFWLGISMESTSNGYLIGAGGEVWKWGGSAWSQVASPSALNMRSVSAAIGSPNVVWAVGSNAKAVRSLDGGLTWNTVATGTSGYLWGVSATDASHAIYGGDSNYAGFSVDGASTSGDTAISAATETFADVASSPTNGQQLLEVGGAGRVRSSSNGGTSWTSQPSGTTASLRAIDWVSSNVAWAVGNGGTIIRTGDGGATWSTQASGATENLTTIDAVDDLRAWAAGEGGRVLHTTNGGGTWTTVTIPSPVAVLDIAAWDDATVSFASRGNSIYRTTNGGASWSAASSTPNAGIAIVSVEYATASTLYAATNFQAIWRSTDGGATYAHVPGTLPADDISSLHVLDANRIVASGGFRSVVVSLDAGATWTSKPLNLDQTLGFTVIDENTVVAVGRVAGQASTTMSVATNETAANYGGAPNNWAGAATTSMFGVCLQSLGGSAAAGAGWTVDGDTTCTASDSDPWKAIPASVATIATTPIGATGSVDLVWGVRFGASTLPGRYSATVAVEVVAPSI